MPPPLAACYPGEQSWWDTTEDKYLCTACPAVWGTLGNRKVFGDDLVHSLMDSLFAHFCDAMSFSVCYYLCLTPKPKPPANVLLGCQVSQSRYLQSVELQPDVRSMHPASHPCHFLEASLADGNVPSLVAYAEPPTKEI